MYHNNDDNEDDSKYLKQGIKRTISEQLKLGDIILLNDNKLVKVLY